MTTETRRDGRSLAALGGLVVKAGLGNADRAFLLGVMVEAAKIEPGTPDYARLHAIGTEAFLNAVREKYLKEGM